jgi:hypothetical protein
MTQEYIVDGPVNAKTCRHGYFVYRCAGLPSPSGFDYPDETGAIVCLSKFPNSTAVRGVLL